MTIERVIIEPVVTEKTNIMRERHQYTFRVDARANKFQIMQTVARQFSVHPLKCNVITVRPKPKRLRNREGLTSSWKKAIITLPPEEKISIFEGA
jgi:large subunit ribosomal protein L23